MRSGGVARLLAVRHALLALAAGVSLGIALVACGGHAAALSSTGSRQASALPAAVPSGDWLEFDYNPQRTGVGPASTGINGSDLHALRTRVVNIAGVADSSAVELHGIYVKGHVRDVIFITTTYGKTIAIDPASGAILWQFVPGDIGSYVGSSQITTATPLIDPSRAYLYTASPDGRVHKLAVASGAEARSGYWPVRVTFDATHEKLAAAFNINGSSLVVTTGGYYGDSPSYQGHVVVIERSTGAITNVWNSLCSDRHHLIDPTSSCPASDSAIWGRSGAVIEPGSGRILVATGNAPFNGSTDWGDSVLELSPDAATLLHNWTPRDQAQLNTSDTDLGSTAPAILPVVRGYRLAVQGGKDGLLHLLNLNRLNGTPGAASGRLGGSLQAVSSPGGGEVLTAPAVWSHAGQVYVFAADDSGTAAYVLRVGRRPRLEQVWENGSSGTSPLIAGNLLYVYDERAGRLDIYGPARGALFRSLPGAAGHWSSPIVIGGRIIVPTGGSTANNASHSQVFIYHLPGR